MAPDSDNVSKEQLDVLVIVQRLEKNVHGMTATVNNISNVLIGTLDKPDGLLTRVAKNELEVKLIRAKMEKDAAKVGVLEDWISGVRHRAAGIAIGLSLGSAGVGAVVSQVVGELFR